MIIDHDIQKAVKALSKMKPGKPFERFISHIRFPRFKNLKPGARIDFCFPLTALVGGNGCGKTSVIHALYGAPERSSTSDYWFSTSIDEIESRESDPQRFIYGHWLKDPAWLPDGDIVETRKARVKKANDPEYWEPTKVTLGDGMNVMPDAGSNPHFGGPKERVRSLDRWSAVKRDVLYLNFRSELGAFDQFFWFGQLRRGAKHTRQDEIRAKSALLKKVLNEDLPTLSWHGRERVFRSEYVSKDDLNAVSDILGKRYTSARMIEHDLYGGQRALTVVFTEVFTEDVAYSEAFAGSGEMAVVSLVVQVRAQKNETLILLDEPEVSLHPAAQKRLLHFLLEECRKKHHQVVFTTHSPHLIEDLPAAAIKLFVPDAAGYFDVLNEVHPYAAFHRLGATSPKRIKVLVEDRLAKHVVDLASNLLTVDEQATLDVEFLPGGASIYFTHRIPTLMREKNVWILFDGDQKRCDSRASSEIANSDLEKTIQALTGGGQKIIFGADGSVDKDSLRQEQKKYIDYVHERVRFLPRSCPEEIVLKAVDATATPSSSTEAKEQLRKKLEGFGLTPSSSDSDAQAQLLLAQNQTGNADLQEIAAILKSMFASISSGAMK